MDATFSRSVDEGVAEGRASGHGEPRSLRPNRAYWRIAMSGAAPPTAARPEPWAALAAAAGIAGAGGLAVLAGIRPDLGGYGPAALISALAAACAPVALCWRLAVAIPERHSSASLERRRAELDALERVLAEQVAAARHETAGPQHGSEAAEARPGTAALNAALRMRRHTRIRPRKLRTFIATEDGRRLNALIIDVSQSGVAIEGNLPGLWIGSMVTVGSRRAKAVRVLPRGMAFEFSTPVAAEALTADFVL